MNNLEATRAFYGGILGCRQGRCADRWIDWDFFGHQLSTHLVDTTTDLSSSSLPSTSQNLLEETNPVDGDAVPARHFGCILRPADWHALVAQLQQAKITFRIAPKVRFENLAGQQYTFFIDDPSGNCLEFKAFEDESYIFRRDAPTDQT